ncbi:MAG: permease prefix domain 1-containing protein [Cellulomonas sp.]|uniref:permease prefix domain 1-containing protein n=1 Tax=Cellulomonas sp. TaxID=40001 RepID=UPI002583DA23|nr:permease prefix domain 1-containing protein [Cellulomonas sp.]MCR6703458.1 permease prefix domain 1-containing protein [Cellulomonas sp.]
MTEDGRPGVEHQIDQWRAWVLRREAITTGDAAELEDNLRGRIADLRAAGLDDDEAFLVAVRRMGNLDDVSREFARAHSERLWKQLVLPPSRPSRADGHWRDLGVLIALAVGAGIAVRWLLVLEDEGRFALNVAFAVLPFLAAYFAWSRRLPARAAGALAVMAAALAVVVNLFPFFADEPGVGLSTTAVLAATHLPVLLWLLLGVAYTGGAWREHARRMDFVRFTGELVVYFTLLALGGGLLTGLLLATFDVVGIDAEPFVQSWLLPFAVPGAFLVAAWLVEAKQSVVENMAPVLTRVFTPLTLGLLVAALVALLAGGPLTAVDRSLLVLMDGILLLVVALLLYAISARDPITAGGPFDWLQLGLVVTALAVDVVALTAMASRIADAGWTANKAAALGLNVVLLVHLVGTGWLLWRFLRAHGTFDAVERWQTRYLVVYAVWAAIVVLVFPPAFSYA